MMPLRVHIDAVLDPIDHAWRGSRVLFDEIALTWRQRLFCHPDDVCFEMMAQRC